MENFPPLGRKAGLLFESIKDFQYVNHEQILMPSSKILIGTANSIEDANLYEASDLTWSFANGVGPLGLDAGAEADTTWYALYAIPSSGNTYSVIASNNRPQDGGPTGFSKWRYLGVFRNGGNAWDATNNSYGMGDIARFVKMGPRMRFQTFHTNNGGVYPAMAFGIQSGINMYIANTATDTIHFNSATQIGMGNLNVPYLNGFYQFSFTINSIVLGYLRQSDSSGNNRRGFALGLEYPSTSLRQARTDFLSFDIDSGWAGQLRSTTNVNPNVSRTLMLDALIDPHLV